MCYPSASAYVLQVKVEMELEIQQCEKTKAVREEQLERLTQICQEQAVSTFFFNPTPSTPKKKPPHEMMGPHAQSSYGCIDNTQHNIHITIKDDSLGLSIHWA